MRHRDPFIAHAAPRRGGPVVALLVVVLAGAALVLPPLGSTAAEAEPAQLVALRQAATPEVDPNAPAIHPAARPDGPVVDALDTAAATHDLSPSLLRAVAWTESSFRPGAVSHAGAVGVMQLMPDTVTHAEQLLGRTIDPLDVTDNVDGGAAYLAYLLDRADGDTRLALTAYFQGWTGLHRDGPTPTSAAYAQRILDLRDQLSAVV